MATATISEIQLFNSLKEKLGSKQAEELVTYVKQSVSSELNDQLPHLASKEDILKLESKISETKVDIIKWIFGFFFALAMMIIGLYLKN
jgi:hypothetical protein